MSQFEKVSTKQPPTRLPDGIYLSLDTDYPEDDMALVVFKDNIIVLGYRQQECQRLADRLSQTYSMWTNKPRLNLNHPDGHIWLERAGLSFDNIPEPEPHHAVAVPTSVNGD